jgi:predicted phosphohydrolase
MRIQYASDLHLEFPENKAYLGKIPLKAEGDILLLAGDIVPMCQIDRHNDFFKFLSDNFSVTYWLPGNHEFYHSDIDQIGGSLNERLRENVHIVNNTTVKIENGTLIFSTLWSKISPENMLEIVLRYSDFHVIGYKGRSLSVPHYNYLHEQSLLFLKDQLTKETGTLRIVVTHHVPSFINYPETYLGDPLNEAFAVELKDLIGETGPDYWIFGHSHFNSGNFKIGKTRMLKNTLGYIRFNEQKDFRRSIVIDI